MTNKERKEELMRKMNRAAKISLCSALAGSLVLGGISAVNHLGASEVKAAVEGSQLTLLKNEDKQDTERRRGGLDVSDIVEEAMPSVVSITTRSVQEVEDYFGMFGFYGYAPRTQQEVEGGGSGIIIGKNDEELLIVTNNHVVQDADTLSVCFVDNNAYEGIVKSYSEDKDLAVVAVKLDDISTDTLKEISFAKIGSSDDLKVGEQVVVIGNAMGYGQSVTTGIVSAKNRYYNSKTGSFKMGAEDDEEGINVIQTDAAINPGNSGGALLNMDGEVVGINSAKTALTTVEGMCYAIAISDVDDEVLQGLMNQKTRAKVAEGAHGVLGIKATSVSREANQIYGIPMGAFIAEVDKDSAAEKAGIEEGSIITEFDGFKVDSVESLINRLEYYEPGEEVEIVASVQDGRDYTSETYVVTLQEKAEEESDDDSDSDENDASNDDQERDDLFRDWEREWGFWGGDDYDENYDADDEDADDENADDDDDDDDDEFFGQGTFGEWH